MLKELASRRPRSAARRSVRHQATIRGLVFLSWLSACVGADQAREAAEKHERFASLWALAAEAIQAVDPQHAATYSAIAVTKCFVGSPHIDTCVAYIMLAPSSIGPPWSLAGVL